MEFKCSYTLVNNICESLYGKEKINCTFAQNYYLKREMKKSIGVILAGVLIGYGSEQSMASVNTIPQGVVAVDSLIESSFMPGVFIRPGKEKSEFLNLVYNYRRQQEEASERWNDIYLIITGLRTDPDYYKLVIPATYYAAPIIEAMSIDDWQPETPFSKPSLLEKELENVPDVQRTKRVDQAINRQLLDFYTHYPQLVQMNEEKLKALDVPQITTVEKKSPKEEVKKFVQPNVPSGQVIDKDLLVFKPNFWTTGGNGYLQFSQNYISSNWYKGGESTVSLLSGFVWQANYDDKQRTQIENKIEWKLGFITAPSDTLHSYKANNDLLRITSKIGYKAISNWYYTLSGEFKTQFFSSYETNTNNLVSSFLSPAELNLGLGMDYKYIKDNVCNISVLINPINYTLYSIADDRLDPTKFNIKEGHKRESIWGSKLEATWKWKLMQTLMWESRLSYTTNYEKVLAEWENTFTFTFNKYLSTKLFFHGRFDDGVTREPGDSYLQIQELLSFGLNYTW